MKENPRQGDLRVWWCPQVPTQKGAGHFFVDVKTEEEGTLIFSVLAEYDLYQESHRIKPDYSNAGGLVTWDGEDWMDVDEEEWTSFDDRFDLDENRRKALQP